MSLTIYEFNASLRIAAEDESQARDRALALADAISHGEATLALDSSTPPLKTETSEDRG